MVRLGDLPSINQHWEEEDNEAEGSPGPRHRAGRGQGAASDAVDVVGAGRDNGNVPGNTLGGSNILLGDNFSPGVRTSPGGG